MVIGKVIGEVVATVKIDCLVGQKFLLVEVQRIVTDSDHDTMVSTGSTLVANDRLGAGRGDTVLVTQGASARMTDATATLPTDALIVGIVDTVSVGSPKEYRKND